MTRRAEGLHRDGKRAMLRPCNECGVLYVAVACRVAAGKMIYCSRTCSGTHNARLRTNHSPRTGRVNAQPLRERFWSRVNRDGPIQPHCPELGPCWVWTGRCDRPGYGRFMIRKRPHLTHRIAWAVARWPIPPGLFVLHRCDNPPCVRPSHLFLGTQLDNMRDAVSKRRNRNATGHRGPRLLPRPPLGQARGERSPHAKLSEAEVRRIRDLYATGVSGIALVRQFGVGQSEVYRILNRTTWAHVA